MFMPFRCKSHSMALLSVCGNICCILSTAISPALSLASGDRDDCAPAFAPAPLKKRYRMMKPKMTSITRNTGVEIWSSDMVDDCVSFNYYSSRRRWYRKSVVLRCPVEPLAVKYRAR